MDGEGLDVTVQRGATRFQPPWAKGPSPVKGATQKTEIVYRKILAAAREFFAFPGMSAQDTIRQRELRWLLAEPGTDLFGGKDKDTADDKLAERLGNGDKDQGEWHVQRLRDTLWQLGVAPLDEEEHCSRKVFTDYLSTLDKHGQLLRVDRGKYRLPPVPFAGHLMDQGPEVRETIGRRGQTVALNLPDSLDEQEKTVLDLAGDLTDLAAQLVSLIVSNHHRSDGFPLDYDSAFLLLAGDFPNQTLHRGDIDGEEAYADALPTVRAQLEAVLGGLAGHDPDLEGYIENLVGLEPELGDFEPD